jgi:uncharacterized protein
LPRGRCSGPKDLGYCTVRPISPCINVCRMHIQLGLCEGCARTLDEIASWGQMDELARDRIWNLLPDRQARLRQAGVVPHRERSNPA